jgi:hypothetical protein
VSIRWFIGIVGAVLVVAGLVFLNLPVNVTDSIGTSVPCGTPWNTSTADKAQRDYSVSREADSLLGREVGSPPDCTSALATRQMWAYPILIAGGLVTLGAAVVRSPNRPRPA